MNSFPFKLGESDHGERHRRPAPIEHRSRERRAVWEASEGVGSCAQPGLVKLRETCGVAAHARLASATKSRSLTSRV